MRMRILAAALCAVILTWWIPSAWAMGANVVFKPSNGNPSDRFTIEGQMFHPNEKVFINWRSSSARLAEVQADAAGNLTVTVQVPSDAHPGPNLVIIAGDQGSGVGQEFTVGGPAQGPDPEREANDEDEDNDVQPWILGVGGIAVGLMLGGLLFRRKSA